MYNLTHLYTPKCIISSRNKSCYVQIKPSDYLSKFIYCYWASPSDSYNNQLDLYPYIDESVVPDGCLDIVFNIDRKTRICKSTIYGTFDKPFLVNFAYNRIQTFGITFCPGDFIPF